MKDGVCHGDAQAAVKSSAEQTRGPFAGWDAEMFVFEGNPPPFLSSSWPYPSQLQKGGEGEGPQALHFDLRFSELLRPSQSQQRLF